MINDVINDQWKIIGDKIRHWQDERHPYRLERMNREREQFIVTLQKRYGYTKEKATSELNTHYSKIKYG